MTRQPDVRLDSVDPQALHAAYDEARRRCPVAWSDGYGGHWVLTRHDDVRAAATDADLFISSVRAVVPSDPRGIRRPPLNFDAPHHTPYRRALTRTLTRTSVEALLEGLRPLASGLFSAYVHGTDPDIARTFGTRLPAHAAAAWLRLEDDRAEWLATTASEWVDAWRRQDAAEVNRRSAQMYDVARWLVADRERSPRDPAVDPASALLAERVDGEPLDRELVVGALRQSLVVGMVAPPLLIGGMAHHLAVDPVLQTRLREDRDARGPATEEFLRLLTPYRGFARTVSRTTTLRGREIAPKEPVTLVYAAANRDPEVFADPHAFMLDRPNIGEHLAFGLGRHQCVGMHLARGLARIALDVMLDGAVRLVLQGQPAGTRMPEIGLQRVTLDLVALRR